MNDSLSYIYEIDHLIRTLKSKGITNSRVLNAFRKVPRHRFIGEHLTLHAYKDIALPIENDQTISQPYTVAYQTELLQVTPKDKVLEIGTGSGYQTAILCEMEAEVYSIERFQHLHKQAQSKLEKLGYHPHLFYGDGYEGLPDYAPFSKILITAATPTFPPELLKQLAVGGRMVAPIGFHNYQVMTVVVREHKEKYIESQYGVFRFVPMIKGIAE